MWYVLVFAFPELIFAVTADRVSFSEHSWLFRSKRRVVSGMFWLMLFLGPCWSGTRNTEFLRVKTGLRHARLKFVINIGRFWYVLSLSFPELSYVAKS